MLGLTTKGCQALAGSRHLGLRPRGPPSRNRHFGLFSLCAPVGTCLGAVVEQEGVAQSVLEGAIPGGGSRMACPLLGTSCGGPVKGGPGGSSLGPPSGNDPPGDPL